MQLDPQAVEEFKELYLKEYGENLSNQEAILFAARLIAFVKAVYGKSLPNDVKSIKM